MKAENTDQAPKFNLLAPEGVKPQAKAGDITAVLLNDGNWYVIEPGSFHLYQSAAKAPSFGPYCTFRVDLGSPETPDMQTVEVFPATVAGWSFR